MTVSPAQFSKVRAIADALIASCDGGLSMIDDVMDLSLEECGVLDTMARECYVCGQWSDIREMTDTDDGDRSACASSESGEWRCVDCKP